VATLTIRTAAWLASSRQRWRSNALRVSADGPVLIGMFFRAWPFHQQPLQPQPMNTGLRIQTSSLFTFAMTIAASEHHREANVCAWPVVNGTKRPHDQSKRSPVANIKRKMYHAHMDEGRKRVLLIAASILAARKLAQYEGGTRVPVTISAIADAVRWAEMIMAEIDKRWE
jgi:hypothetical protein